jgi:hypothetical protein
VVKTQSDSWLDKKVCPTKFENSAPATV